MDNIQHITRFERGFDCMKFECAYGSADCKPNTGGSHGKSGLTIRFVAKGAAGAVQFVLLTGWGPQFKRPDELGFRDCEWGEGVFPMDLGRHSKAPMYEGEEQASPTCEYCDGQPCYCDCSTLNATNAMYALVNGGDEGLWAFLDAYYAAVFEGAEYPEPTEYKKKLR